ncbi:MAG TPA: DUF4893 domain-containing protein [Rhizomicrobium sp.]|jgi:hypothetical protein|nr:DUF4893 domain-containing protein [Rhizomicrobium sp.]
MRALKLILIASSLALVATAASAGWQETASQADQDRISRIEEAKAKALGEAAAGPDMAVIHSVIDPAAMPTSEGALTGAWRCRTIKMGGITPSVVYAWFNCRIADRGGHLFFQKVTGSQRTQGWLYPNGDGTFVYLGASSVGPEKPHTYSGNGATAGASATPDDQIGVLSAIGDRHARIEMPYPLQESTFDVLELKR